MSGTDDYSAAMSLNENDAVRYFNHPPANSFGGYRPARMNVYEKIHNSKHVITLKEEKTNKFLSHTGSDTWLYAGSTEINDNTWWKVIKK
ncbi:hypothetical protein [Bacillus cereus]|uniref:hypothetical protein n=1 Tax=Bacillus cereus TaxID=1396 RepID=UPI0011454147|nr:hypothetical protein [Bacillus cereus]